MAIEDVWWERLEQWLIGSRVLDYSAPVPSAAGITLFPFGPHKTGNTWTFRTALRFESAAQFPVVSMVTGTIFFQPSSTGNPARIVLVRGDLTAEVIRRKSSILPETFHIAPYIVYDNMDTTAVKNAITAICSDSTIAEPAIERVKKADPSFQTGNDVAGQLAALWMTEALPGGLFVLAGDTIGASATAAGGFALELSMVDTIVPAASIFYNPSHYLAAAHELGWLKDPLFPELIDVTGPPAANGTITTITSGTSIANAVASALSGDTILITDTAIYDEAIVIDKDVNVMSTSVTPADAQVLDYPIITGQNTKRPLTFRNINFGMAYAGRLIVEHGLATAPREDGGGVLVERSENAVLASLVIRQCSTRGGDRYAKGFGGGIAIYHSSPAIFRCQIVDNEANGRGKGIGIWGYGWPTVFGCRLARNTSRNLGPNPRHDGGGMAIEIGVTNAESDADMVLGLDNQPLHAIFDHVKLQKSLITYVRVVDSVIEDNIAGDDGGGIYISTASRLILRRTTIANNRASANGGGIRSTFAADLILRDCHIIGNQSNEKLLRLGENAISPVMGGGIAIRNGDRVDLVRTKISGNTSNYWAGGGLSFLSTDEGDPVSWQHDLLDIGLQILGINPNFEFDWNTFLFDPLIYNHQSPYIRIDGESRITENSATILPTDFTSALYSDASAGDTAVTLTNIAGLVGIDIVINEGGATMETARVVAVPSSATPWHADLDHPLQHSHMANELVGRVVDNHGKGGGIYLLRWVGPRASGLALPDGFESSNGEMEAWPLDVMIMNTPAVLPATGPNQNHASFPGTDRICYDNWAFDTNDPWRTYDDQELADREASGIKTYVNER